MKIIDKTSAASRKTIQAGTFLKVAVPNVGWQLILLAQTSPGRVQPIVLSENEANRKNDRIVEPASVYDITDSEVTNLLGTQNWQTVEATITVE